MGKIPRRVAGFTRCRLRNSSTSLDAILPEGLFDIQSYAATEGVPGQAHMPPREQGQDGLLLHHEVHELAGDTDGLDDRLALDPLGSCSLGGRSASRPASP